MFVQVCVRAMSDIDQLHRLAFFINLTNRLNTMENEHARDKMDVVHLLETQRKAHVALSRQVGEMIKAVVTLQDTVAAQAKDIAALKLEMIQSEIDAVKADTKHLKANQS